MLFLVYYKHYFFGEHAWVDMSACLDINFTLWKTKMPIQSYIIK